MKGQGQGRNMSINVLPAPGPSFLLIIKYAPIYILVMQPYPAAQRAGVTQTRVVSERLSAFTPFNLFRVRSASSSNDRNLLGNAAAVLVVRDRVSTMYRGRPGATQGWTQTQRPSYSAELKAFKPQAQLLN